MTKVNGLIDTLKYIPIYANIALHMWARVWGKIKKLTFATIINNIVFSCIVDADINNGFSALQGRCYQHSVISISHRTDIMVANVAAASTIPQLWVEVVHINGKKNGGKHGALFDSIAAAKFGASNGNGAIIILFRKDTGQIYRIGVKRWIVIIYEPPIVLNAIRRNTRQNARKLHMAVRSTCQVMLNDIDIVVGSTRWWIQINT